MARTGWVVALRPLVLGTREGTGQDLAGRGLMAAGDANTTACLPGCWLGSGAPVPLLTAPSVLG